MALLTGRAEKTQKDYRRYLKMIEEEFGTMPLAVVQDRRARGKFKESRDGRRPIRGKRTMHGRY